MEKVKTEESCHVVYNTAATPDSGRHTITSDPDCDIRVSVATGENAGRPYEVNKALMDLCIMPHALFMLC